MHFKAREMQQAQVTQGSEVTTKHRRKPTSLGVVQNIILILFGFVAFIGASAGRILGTHGRRLARELSSAQITQSSQVETAESEFSLAWETEASTQQAREMHQAQVAQKLKETSEGRAPPSPLSLDRSSSLSTTPVIHPAVQQVVTRHATSGAESVSDAQRDARAEGCLNGILFSLLLFLTLIVIGDRRLVHRSRVLSQTVVQEVSFSEGTIQSASVQ
jgi:hypothetical protein